MRHGKAVGQAQVDSSRELSVYGRRQVQAMIQCYGSELAAVDMVWSSDYTRAYQTAKMVANYRQCPHHIKPWLRPVDSLGPVLSALSDTDQTLLIVSHQPLVGTLLDSLAGLESGRYYMETAAIACLQYELPVSGSAEILWLHQPSDATRYNKD